jgi:hypothetical protein
MSCLNAHYRSWGLVVSRGVLLHLKLFILSWSWMPWETTLNISLYFWRDGIDQVHRPGPMRGASFGEYLMVMIQWLVGVGVGPMCQPYMCREVPLAMYIWSRRDWICWPFALLQYVKHLSVGWEWCHASWSSQLWQISHRADMALRSSGWAGALSMFSSVTLLSFSRDCAARDVFILSFLQIFDELYLVQFSTNRLALLSVIIRICRLDVREFIELETTSLGFRFLTSTSGS